MDELKDIYDRITYLRHKGMNMKDIAALVDYPPSVLSALYTTVVPAFLKNKALGMQPEEALDGALVWVNNVSKRRLLSSLAAMKATLMAADVDPAAAAPGSATPYSAALSHIMERAAERMGSHAGTYLSYSVSSGSRAMKVEPYMIAPARGGYAEVWHNNAYGATHRGLVMMNGASHIFLIFNEIFVRHSDSTSPEEFASLRGCLKEQGTLSGDEQAYYDYTCGADDVVRLCNIPSPTLRIDDLAEEKWLLSALRRE